MRLLSMSVAVICALLTPETAAFAQKQQKNYPDADPVKLSERARRDEAELRREAEAALARILGTNRYADEIKIRYLGQERLEDIAAFEPDGKETPDGYGGERAEAITGFHAFNPDSLNVFELELPKSLIRLVGKTARQKGLNDDDPGPMGGPPIEGPIREPTQDYEQKPPQDYEKKGDATPSPEGQLFWGGPLLLKASWSNNSDDRFKFSSTLAAVTQWPYRAIAHMSNNCSAAFFGPRHVITAGHCVYSRRKGSWNNITNITPGLAGSNFNFGQVGFPAPGFNWRFTPGQWRTATSPAHFQYDFGIMIVAERLGDQTGQMGFGTLTDASLEESLLRNRGYPWCTAVTSSGALRIDDPGDDPPPPGSDGGVSNVTCLQNHLYGDPRDCAIGGYRAEDDEGWTRRFFHSCDASAGQSGSPIYAELNGIVYIVGIHTRSLCGKTATDTACTDADETPLVATRITPEYADWMSYFKAWKP